ncbi:MAG: hypothetical protein OSB70_19925 [Myxococcota bacterium]|jgi:hypothetical protein|nr:hypothetical protein [Myxococcota bacterium]
MARDYYAEAEAVCEELEGLGRSDVADDLRAAIEGGSTATEILMALRWSLEQSISAEIDLGSAEVKMRSLKEGLDAALG